MESSAVSFGKVQKYFWNLRNGFYWVRALLTLTGRLTPSRFQAGILLCHNWRLKLRPVFKGLPLSYVWPITWRPAKIQLKHNPDKTELLVNRSFGEASTGMPYAPLYEADLIRLVHVLVTIRLDYCILTYIM